MDSGLGGLSVLREIRRQAPGVELIYYADSAHCPYGERDAKFIKSRTLEIAEALIEKGAEVIVLACNTASAAALEWLRTQIDEPVVGMEPAVKPAASATVNRNVGVLATSVTLQADRFARLIERFGRSIEVHTEPAPELVRLVERGEVSGPEVERIVGQKIRRLEASSIDTLVLGCTHFPFLSEVIRRLAGPNVHVIDTGESVAAQTLRVYLGAAANRSLPDGVGRVSLLTSGSPREVLRSARALDGSIPFELSSLP